MPDSSDLPNVEDLVRRYADATDDELREARSLGKDSYRPEAWSVIQAEIRRRGESFQPGRPRHLRTFRTKKGSGRWTTGLTLGLLVAVPLVAETARRMYQAGMFGGRRPRGGPAVLIALFVVVWFGVALFYDLTRWLRHRRHGSIE